MIGGGGLAAREKGEEGLAGCCASWAAKRKRRKAWADRCWARLE